MDWMTPAMFGLVTAVVTGSAAAALRIGRLNPAGRGLAILAAAAAGGVAVHLVLTVGRGVQMGSWVAGSTAGATGTELVFLLAGGACLLAAAAMAAMAISAGARLRAVEGLRGLLAVQTMSVGLQMVLLAGVLTPGSGPALLLQLGLAAAATVFASRAFVSMRRYGLLDLDPVRLPARGQHKEMVAARS